jgi:GldM C-terminal domain
MNLTTSLLSFALGFGAALSLSFNVRTVAPPAAIALEQNNVLYVGLDNPAKIVFGNTPPEQLKIEGDGITALPADNHRFYIRATKIGSTKITVTDQKTGQSAEFNFRTSRLPDPTIWLGNHNISNGRRIKSGYLKAQLGLTAWPEGMCSNMLMKIVDFDITIVPKGQDPVTVPNKGARFGEKAQELIQQIQQGDIIFFDNIKVLAPGDAAPREFGSFKVDVI